MTAEQVADHPADTLRRNAVGLPDVIFTSVTTMAPAAGAAFSITVGALFAGGALVDGVIIALAGCLFTALSIGQLAKHLPTAGGMYTYIARGLGSKVGFLAGWGFDFAYPLIVPLVTVLFGSILGSTLQAHFGLSFNVWWVVGTVFSVLLVGSLNYFGIQVSTRFGIILGSFEILVMLALSLTLIVNAGSRNTLSVFTTHFATVPGFKGLSGIIAGSVYGVLAFIGFDAAAPLAEETRDPKRNVSRAVVGSCLIVGLFYVLTTYAATVYFGAGRFVSFYTAGGGNPWNLMATAVWGTGWVALFIAFLNSSAACANGGSCAATRCIWAMGRIRVIPRVFGRTQRRWKSPHIAVFATFGIGLILAVWLGEQYSPTTAFALLGTIITGAILPIYIAVNLACIAYFWRERRSEFNVIKHLLFPVLGIVLFVPGFFADLGVKLFKFVGQLSYPLSLSGLVIGIWYGIGVVLMIYFSVRHPDRIRDTARVFIDDADVAQVATKG
ncbi:MAG TPA: APC family permease [Streptosporangiaceae bacterium]|nr:APC family permease [Streptosporangiaceae bacterium]